MEPKYTFNYVAEQYEKYRPTYPEELIQDIILYSGLTKVDRILEVGCGTGQATSGFVSKGYKNITCIELGENLANFTREKFRNIEGINVINTSFEDWDEITNHFKLAISGTAFHFIEPSFGYKKVHKCLQQGGSMGFFWTVHVPQYDNLFTEIRRSYQKYAPHLDDSKGQSPEEVITERKKMTSDSKLFHDLDVKEYLWYQEYSADDYVELLNTNSRHRLLDESNMSHLFKEIKNAIQSHGGLLRKAQLVALFLGKKI